MAKNPKNGTCHLKNYSRYSQQPTCIMGYIYDARKPIFLSKTMPYGEINVSLTFVACAFVTFKFYYCKKKMHKKSKKIIFFTF